jgi:hypothetical protein
MTLGSDPNFRVRREDGYVFMSFLEMWEGDKIEETLKDEYKFLSPLIIHEFV